METNELAQQAIELSEEAQRRGYRDRFETLVAMDKLRGLNDLSNEEKLIIIFNLIGSTSMYDFIDYVRLADDNERYCDSYR